MDLLGLDPGGARTEADAFLHRLQAFTAPVAADRGALLDDPDQLAVAEAVYAAFGDTGVSGGLTRAQIASACAGVCDEATFNRRFEVFLGLRMLLPIFDKAHQQRYIFNMASGAGLLVWQRLAERGGVDELITLLDRTQSALAAGTATRDEVATNLASSRRWLTVAADHLFQMVSSAPLAELIAARRHHTQDGLIDKVRALSDIVADIYPDLDPDAYRVIQAAQRYLEAREAFVTRLLDEGAAGRDFTLLDHEEYLEAALTRSPAELAEALAAVVVDPPNPWLGPATIADALNAQPRSRTRTRPARPTIIDEPADPLQRRLTVDDTARDRRDRRIELLLQDADTLDLQSRLRADGWPAAANRVADLLAAHADPASPYQVQLSDELLVDPHGPVTYVTPITVHRTRTGADTTPGGTQNEADVADFDDRVGHAAPGIPLSWETADG